MNKAHYLRFVQALALATSACSAGTPDATQSGEDPAASVAPSPTEPRADLVAPPPPLAHEDAADASADASDEAALPHTSGPIVPPESVA
ncbi:MAG TPA: hypothetical protein VGH28_30560 [Polyangiaceae bacterium]|jgi:hypothetical protein